MNDRTSENDPTTSDPAVVVREERLDVSHREQQAGAIRIRTTVDGHQVSEPIERRAEEAVVERHPAEEGDSGEIEELADGSLSIPVLEEELIVTRRVVVRERVIVRKERRTHTHNVEAELRREQVEVLEEPPEA